MEQYQSTSRKAYFESVTQGKVTTQKDRIMRFLLTEAGKPVTRKMLARYFNPRYRENAFDGGERIVWQSMTAAVRHLLDDGYLRIAADRYPPDGEGTCPVSGNKAQFLMPVGDQWERRRLFDADSFG